MMTFGAARALAARPRRILHAGCGTEPLPDWLADGDETRLDINPATRPDVVASMTALGDVGGFDVVYCCHALEHLYPHEVDVALKEFLRVLVSGGVAVVFVPDLEGAPPTDDVLFCSPSGPVAGLDLFYGFRPSLAAGNLHMAHHCGFVPATLEQALRAAGFADVAVKRLHPFNMMGAGKKP